MKLIYKVGVKLIPIAAGYLPVGISFALIATEFGLSNAEIIAMSALVLGAASQIAAVPLIAHDYGVIHIAFVTLLINFRHAALSATLSPGLKNFSRGEVALFSYGLTDEAFSIHALDIEHRSFSKQIAIAVNLGTHLIWVLATVVGCYIGRFIVQNLQFVRLDIALSAMFLSIVVLYLKSKIRDRRHLRYGWIIAANIAMTVLLLYYQLELLAFFLPALIVALAVFFATSTKREGK